MKYLILIPFLIFSHRAYCDDSAKAAATILVLFGAAKGAEAAYEDGAWNQELVDWKDPNTGITSEVVEQCHMLIEARLLGVNRYNSLVLIAKNLGDEIKFKPGIVEFEFENGVTRRADVELSDERTLQKDKKYIIVLPFPRKDDFKDQNKITVKAQFDDGKGPCVSTLNFDRPKEVPSSIVTYTRLTTLEVEFYYGTTSLSGNLSDSGKNSLPTFSTGINIIGARHGMYFSTVSSNSTAAPAKYLQAASITGAGTVSNSSMDLGYINRQILDRNKNILLKIGLGVYRLLLKSTSDKSNYTSFDATSLQLQAQYNYFFAQVDRGFWRGDYGIYFGVDGHWIPDGTIDDNKFDGIATSLFAGLKVGI